jgi:hypothetical protein
MPESQSDADEVWIESLIITTKLRLSCCIENESGPSKRASLKDSVFRKLYYEIEI